MAAAGKPVYLEGVVYGPEAMVLVEANFVGDDDDGKMKGLPVHHPGPSPENSTIASYAHDHPNPPSATRRRSTAPSHSHTHRHTHTHSYSESEPHTLDHGFAHCTLALRCKCIHTPHTSHTLCETKQSLSMPVSLTLTLERVAVIICSWQ